MRKNKTIKKSNSKVRIGIIFGVFAAVVCIIVGFVILRLEVLNDSNRTKGSSVEQITEDDLDSNEPKEIINEVSNITYSDGDEIHQSFDNGVVTVVLNSVTKKENKICVDYTFTNHSDADFMYSDLCHLILFNSDGVSDFKNYIVTDDKESDNSGQTIASDATVSVHSYADVTDFDKYAISIYMDGVTINLNEE